MASRGASGRAQEAWPGWVTEAFCDVFGALCGGTAFALALADFLRVTGPPPAELDGSYPPTNVRLGLCLAVLRECDCAQQASALRSRWLSEGLDVADNDTTFATRAVGRALATTGYRALGGSSLLDVITFGPRREEIAAADAADLQVAKPAQTKDIRVLMAAAGTCFAENPRAYVTAGVATAVLERAQEIREPGVRWRGGEQPPDLDAAQLDATLANDLYALLTSSSA